MRLVVLNVAFPFAPVGPDAVGSPELVLSQLDAALARGGHESIVMACEGSVTQGILLTTPRPAGRIDERTRRATHEQYRFLLEKFLEKWPIDLIHFHGVDFHRYLPAAGVPVLVTLHLPVPWYPPEIFSIDRPQTFLHCVSTEQHAACPECAYLLPPIAGGGPDQYFSLYERLIAEAREREQISETEGTQAAPVAVAREPIFPIPEFARAAT